MREARNLLNLHWLFCLRISAKSWTAFCRDRIAPTCTIRHLVRPIVALQRRVRFSAQLAGFCRIRWHQRRTRRAERASLSGFVSNRDFRVPRLRKVGEQALTGPRTASEKRPPEGSRIEARATLAQRASTFWSRWAWASLVSLLASDSVSIRVRQCLRGSAHPPSSASSGARALCLLFIHPRDGDHGYTQPERALGGRAVSSRTLQPLGPHRFMTGVDSTSLATSWSVSRYERRTKEERHPFEAC